LLSTYAKVGVVAGAAAITGPVGIIVAASIFFLCSACLLCSVSRRNSDKKIKKPKPVGLQLPFQENVNQSEEKEEEEVNFVEPISSDV
jgi:predicted component of type VI protein secretion system